MVSAAHRFHKVPDGHLLTLEWTPGGATVRLRKAPAWMLPTVRDVPVPDTLRPCHPTVRALREDPRRLPMTRVLRQRALLILDALALEAERRGHRVDPPPPQTYSRRRQGALQFTIAGHAFRIDLTETQHQVPVPAAADARRGRGSWAGRPTDRVEGTGLLRVTVLDGLTYHCDAVQDTAATPLEAKLGQVLHEVEARSVLAEDRRREREQEEAERRARWAAAMAAAREALVEHHRARVLHRQAEDWQHATLLRRYLAAMAAHLQTLGDAERPAGAAWLEWARAYVETLDPLTGPLEPPPDPEVTPQALAPFLDGWSPHGPEGRPALRFPSR